MSVEERVALVTGAATGIGAAIAEDLAARGARVIGVDRAWETTAPGARGFEKITCDVADAAEVVRCVADVTARMGGVDILVNNAALAAELRFTPFDQITAEEWMRVMANNTLAPFLCSQAVATGMRERKWGRIVNLTSAVIYAATPGLLHYNASKGAIAAMTRGLAKELGGKGITVNAIAPGLVITEGIADNPDYTRELRGQNVAARCIQRDELAGDLVGTCAFLASEAAAFMTGQILVVDGGALFP